MAPNRIRFGASGSGGRRARCQARWHLLRKPPAARLAVTANTCRQIRPASPARAQRTQGGLPHARTRHPRHPELAALSVRLGLSGWQSSFGRCFSPPLPGKQPPPNWVRHVCRKLMIGSSAAQPAQRRPAWHPRAVRAGTGRAGAGRPRWDHGRRHAAGDRAAHRGPGLTRAGAWAADELTPADIDGLADFMADLHVISVVLLHELHEATGEPSAAILQRLAIMAERRRGTPSAD